MLSSYILIYTDLKDGGYKNIHNHSKHNTNGFAQRPNDSGRKKKIYTILKEKGYSADDMRTAFGEVAFYNFTELKKLENDESKPIITRIIAKQFLTAFEKSDWSKIKEILEHVIGKPNQTIDQNINEMSAPTEVEVVFKDFSKNENVSE